MHKTSKKVEGKRLGRGRTKLMAELHATEYGTVEKKQRLPPKHANFWAKRIDKK